MKITVELDPNPPSKNSVPEPPPLEEFLDPPLILVLALGQKKAATVLTYVRCHTYSKLVASISSSSVSISSSRDLLSSSSTTLWKIFGSTVLVGYTNMS